MGEGGREGMYDVNLESFHAIKARKDVQSSSDYVGNEFNPRLPEVGL